MNWRAALAAVQRWYGSHAQRDRRIIGGVGIAALAALILVSVVDPLRAYRRRVGEEIADGQDRLERAARFAGAIDTLRGERAELKKRLAQANGRLLPGDSGTLGAAALQERANTLANEKSVSVLSTQVMKEEQADPFRKVAVRLTISGELKPFAEFVSGLEYGPQQLTIPFVEVSRRGAVPGAKGPRILSATVEVSGYLRAGGGAKEKAAEVPEGEGEAGAPEAAVVEPAAGEGGVAPGSPPPPRAADVPAAGPDGAPPQAAAPAPGGQPLVAGAPPAAAAPPATAPPSGTAPPPGAVSPPGAAPPATAAPPQPSPPPQAVAPGAQKPSGPSPQAGLPAPVVPGGADGGAKKPPPVSRPEGT